MSASTMNRLAVIFVALSVVALGVAALWRLAQQPMFQLKRLEVRGDLRHVSAVSVRTAVVGRLRGNYFTMRLDETRRVLETVPWVAAASVRRVWPDRLLVTLTEHRALGIWQDGRLLSDRGELFVANPDEAEVYGQLPEFSGPVGAARDAARRYDELSAQFAPLSLRIAGIDISERKAWSLRLASDLRDESKQPNNLHVELGRERASLPLAERAAQVIAAYPLIVTQMGGIPTRIDARYPNGLAASGPANAIKSERTVRP